MQLYEDLDYEGREKYWIDYHIQLRELLKDAMKKSRHTLEQQLIKEIHFVNQALRIPNLDPRPVMYNSKINDSENENKYRYSLPGGEQSISRRLPIIKDVVGKRV